MLFNSLDFALFLPIVFVLYWFVFHKTYKSQNILLLVASYFFYACWDWRFMFLLLFSTLLDYFTGLKMCESTNHNNKKFWFWLSIIINLGFLGVFKYYNFFAQSLADSVAHIGITLHPWMLDIVLPVGISFYTFHGLSYVIDIYKNRIKAEKNIVDYAIFVSYFPLLVAGPIERATHLLPQLQVKRSFNYQNAVDGMRQILWGFFKKVVIADNCARFADMIFNNSEDYSGSTLVAGALFFSLQIYGDFSGYSDIAIGVSKLFGIDLLRNFAFPYFSRDIAEFWRRWHISLSSWFRDYLYFPLGGSQGNTWIKVRNTFIIFGVSGFWHGANWTFIFWGILNAVYFLPLLLAKKNRTNIDIVAKGKVFPSLKEFFQMTTTFALVTLAWIFFRAENMRHALNYIGEIFSSSLFSIPKFEKMGVALTLIQVILFFIIVEWLGRENKHALEKIGLKWNRFFRWFFYSFILFLIGMFISNEETPFIYFQF